MSSIAIAILAAGSASRFGGAKLSANLGGRALVGHSVQHALESGVGPVCVVVASTPSPLEQELPSGVDVVRNPHAVEGIASSLRAAIRHFEARAEIDALCVGLGDQPLVGPDAYRRLAAAGARGAGLVVATYGGERRNPVLLARAVWTDALALRGDEGARRLFRDREVVEVPCDDTGDPVDVDTTSDLEALDRRWRSKGTPI